VPIPPTEEADYLAGLLETVAGVVLTGGLDISPGRYGELAHPETKTLHPRREQGEFCLYGEATRRGLPLLAICLGIQTVNVAHGGTLHQHLPAVNGGLIPHRPAEAQGYDNFHEVQVAEGSRLRGWLDRATIRVNSYHHQGVNRVGTGLRAVAWAADGLIEALERDDYPAFFLAVQWHPERDMDNPVNRRIMARFLQDRCFPAVSYETRER
jgi:putative glutamine amidotransferase